MDVISYQTVTIPSGQTDSDAIELVRNSIVGVRIPAAFTGTTISILESNSATGTFNPISPAGGAATYAAAVNTTIGIPFDNAACAMFCRIRSGSAEAANRTLTVITRTIQ